MAVNSVETVEEDKSESTVTQLQRALANCMKEMAEMLKTFGTARGPVSQPNATMQRGNRPPFNQARGAPMVDRNLRPRVPNMQGTEDRVNRPTSTEGLRCASDARSCGTSLSIVQIRQFNLRLRRWCDHQP